MSNAARETAFWSRVQRGGPDECWEWQAYRNGKGYGIFYHRKDKSIASRVALELRLGRPLMDGMLALHTCDNPSCCNPSHLWEGDHTANMRDASQKGRLYGQKLTHCRKGHRYTAETEYRRRWRECIICRREGNRASWRRCRAAKEQTNADQ